jgi:hypothetical protein
VHLIDIASVGISIVQPAAGQNWGDVVRLLISAVCALAFCLLASGAWADSISIQNPSFEITNPLNQPCTGSTNCFNAGPIPGWSSPAGGFGSFAPTSTFFNLPLPDGSIVAYTNGVTGGATLTQILGVSLLPNSVYTLSVDVGRRLDVTGATYALSLVNGSISNVFCTTGATSNDSIPAGTFEDINLTCTTGASVPGGFLGIELSGDGRQTDFDNVRLNVSPEVVATAEPGALALTLVGLCLVGLFFKGSRRNQSLQTTAS